MSPIPGEPLDKKVPDFVDKDGRPVRLKMPGVRPLGGPVEPEEQDPADEPAPSE